MRIEMPLRPLLFCLAIADFLGEIEGGLVMEYFDDITIRGNVKDLISLVPKIEVSSLSLGLSLNRSKCKFIGKGVEFEAEIASSGLDVSHWGEAGLLGSPLFVEGVSGVLIERCADLCSLTTSLKVLSRHESLFLLRSSPGVPRLLHVLRSTPCFRSPEIVVFNEALRTSLSKISNCCLSDDAWARASLPVHWGGLGVRSVSSLVVPAFLASSTASLSLVEALLPQGRLGPLRSVMEEAEVSWLVAGELSIAPTPLPVNQWVFDDPVCRARYNSLVEKAEGAVRASMLAAAAPSSGCWLEALPSPSLGLRLGDEELRVAVGLRVGCPVVSAHVCTCGVPVALDGFHGLSCHRSAGRASRHASINNILAMALRSAGVPTLLEPGGLLPGDACRPDGATMIPWDHGRCLAWDYTCPDTVAPSHLSSSTIAAGLVAGEAESFKSEKYSDLVSSHSFVPVDIETLGVWGSGASSLVAEIGRRLVISSGDLRSFLFLRQRIGMAMQRGNFESVFETINLPPLRGEGILVEGFD